jgi:serine/threonine protein phosphatase 1
LEWVSHIVRHLIVCCLIIRPFALICQEAAYKFIKYFPQEDILRSWLCPGIGKQAISLHKRGCLPSSSCALSEPVARGEMRPLPLLEAMAMASRRFCSIALKDPHLGALAWLLQKQPVIAPIIGATKISHLKEAVGAERKRSRCFAAGYNSIRVGLGSNRISWPLVSGILAHHIQFYATTGSAPAVDRKCWTTDVIYAIGDIHGQHAMLSALLDKLLGLPLHTEDTVVFLGDYVDRGENVRAVIETLLQWRDRHTNTVFLRGNHEQLMMDAYGDAPESAALSDLSLRSQLTLAWLQNGGVETLLSYAPPGFEDWCETLGYVLLRIPAGPLAEFKASFPRWLEVIPKPHWEFLRATQIDYVTTRYHFVHAGLLPPGKTWQSEGWTIDPRLWVREPFLSSRADFDGHIVVFGHTPQRNRRPLIHRNKIGLDTGAVFGGPLTAGVFAPQGHAPGFIQVPYMSSTSLPHPDPDRSVPARLRASSARSSRK